MRKPRLLSNGTERVLQGHWRGQGMKVLPAPYHPREVLHLFQETETASTPPPQSSPFGEELKLPHPPSPPEPEVRQGWRAKGTSCRRNEATTRLRPTRPNVHRASSACKARSDCSVSAARNRKSPPSLSFRSAGGWCRRENNKGV